MQVKDLIPWNRVKNVISRKVTENENPVSELRRNVDRLFNEFWDRFSHPLAAANGLLGTMGAKTDISESKDYIEVSVELPGMDEKDFEVTIANDALTIRGEKKSAKEGKGKDYFLSERSFGAFYRTVALPPGADTDKAKAEFKNGVLTITLPKTPEAQAKVKKIEVQAR